MKLVELNILFEDDKKSKLEKAYDMVAAIQRGEPESAMEEHRAQIGNSIKSYALEHVGDLTHRMGSPDPGEVINKAHKVLKYLKMDGRQTGTYEDQLRIQLRDNAKGKNRSYEEHRELDQKLSRRYSEAHKKIPVFNDLLYHAREAAIRLGYDDVTGAINSLGWIIEVSEDGTFFDKLKEFDPNYKN